MKTARMTFGMMGVLLSATLAAGLALAGCASGGTAAGQSGASTTWYVRENGNDRNSGTTEDAPFKTLAHAITRAAATPVKTITVLGTLTTPAVIENISSADEILITGKTGETAELKMGGDRPISLKGSIKIRLEGIAITGSSSLRLQGGAVLTLGSGARITGCGGVIGGAVVLGDNGTMLVMESDSEISGNKSWEGGGVHIYDGAGLVMKGNAAIKGNSTVTEIVDESIMGGQGGGVYVRTGASLLMQDNASISGNKARMEVRQGQDRGGNGATGVGGGIYAENSGTRITLQDNAVVADNEAGFAGGGVLLRDGATLLLKGTSSIKGNKATGFRVVYTNSPIPGIIAGTGGVGGGVLALGDGTGIVMEDGASIQNNSANERGGGILIANSATFTQNTGVVSGNTAGRGDPDILRE